MRVVNRKSRTWGSFLSPRDVPVVSLYLNPRRTTAAVTTTRCSVERSAWSATRNSHVIVLDDDVVVSALKAALPAYLTKTWSTWLGVDRQATEDDIVAETLDLRRQEDAETDRERVAEVVGAWQGGGLGVVGPEATLRALEMGQVEELLIFATAGALEPVQRPIGDAPAPLATQTSAAGAATDKQLELSNGLVTLAQQTGTRVRIIEDPELLKAHGGVAAALRFRI